MTQLVGGHSRCSRYLRPICRAKMNTLSSKTGNSTSVCILGGGPVGLLLSSILSSYGVKHCIVERREVPTKHPQAHFMNARTMEILQAHLPLAFQSILRETPQSKNWRDFVYCHSVTGRAFSRVDHFLETSPLFWEETPANVIHLPQNKFEIILRKEVLENTRTPAELLFGYEAKKITYSAQGTHLLVEKSKWGRSGTSEMNDEDIEIRCDYLVAADGANSLVRRSLDISLKGEESMHTLMNIHFTCAGLLDLLMPRPAMLYFVFNEAVVAVFVAHDPEKNEWVCQIPIFPPFRNPEDFDHATIQRLLRKALSIPSAGSSTGLDKNRNLEIDVLSVNSWTMHAQVAESFTNEHENVFLAGDAAHRFPPAGGFGMNTGLQDAHNIAWKLAMVVKGHADKTLLSTYESERKPVAEANTALSMRNYEKSASVARLLGVDPALAKIAINTAKSSVSSLVPLSVRKVAINGILDAGLSTLALLSKPGYVLGDVRVKMVQRMMARKESLPLIFPLEDLDFDYCIPVTQSHKAKSLKESIFGSSTDADFSQPLLRVGGKAPHSWLSLRHPFLPPSNVTADGSQRHDPSYSSASTPPQPSLVSSVSLCGLTHSYYSSLDAKGDSRARVTNSDPKITLLVDDSQYDFWESAGGDPNDSMFRLVAVRRGRVRPEGSSSAFSPLEHCEVQKVLQQPHYNIDGAEGSSPDNKNEDRRDEETVLMGKILQNEEGDGDATCSRTSVHDFTGRWMEICSRYEKDKGIALGVSGSALYCSVAVRPDGHVAAIFLPQDCSTHEKASKNMSELRRTLKLI